MRWLGFFSCLLLLVSLVVADHQDAAADKAPRLTNLGTHQRKVTTSSKEAQQFFDQALILCYAFNHAEAIRAFREAARLDPECAMAWWGMAFAYGANINVPMSEEAIPKANAAMEKAVQLAPKAAPWEQAWIQALTKRYAAQPPKDRAPLDKAFADAMRGVVKQYPDDLDAAVLFAEAVLDTMPWDYWTEDGKPKPATEEVLATLEAVLKRNPDHPGACHYYIHAVEASPQPERGLAAAYRLTNLVPGAGHLVHMPSHIYLRVGQYHNASLCNERAIAVDEEYITRHKVKGLYPMMYFTHNIHFLWYSTSMEGRSADSLRAARRTVSQLTPHDVKEMPEAQGPRLALLFGLARFGRWDDLLREPRPKDETRFVTAMDHYARALAYLRKGQSAEAEQEIAAFTALTTDKDIDPLDVQSFPGASLLRIARLVLEAEKAGTRGETDLAVAAWTAAIARQDKIPYMEPPYWYYPLRQSLGALLVRTGRFAEAEKIYREDLRRNPENGWSLFGLLQCQRAVGQHDAAAETERHFREAWKYSDVVLTSSAF